MCGVRSFVPPKALDLVKAYLCENLCFNSNRFFSCSFLRFYFHFFLFGSGSLWDCPFLYLKFLSIMYQPNYGGQMMMGGGQPYGQPQYGSPQVMPHLGMPGGGGMTMTMGGMPMGGPGMMPMGGASFGQQGMMMGGGPMVGMSVGMGPPMMQQNPGAPGLASNLMMLTMAPVATPAVAMPQMPGQQPVPVPVNSPQQPFPQQQQQQPASAPFRLSTAPQIHPMPVGMETAVPAVVAPPVQQQQPQPEPAPSVGGYGGGGGGDDGLYGSFIPVANEFDDEDVEKVATTSAYHLHGEGENKKAKMRRDDSVNSMGSPRGNDHGYDQVHVQPTSQKAAVVPPPSSSSVGIPQQQQQQHPPVMQQTMPMPGAGGGQPVAQMQGAYGSYGQPTQITSLQQHNASYEQDMARFQQHHADECCVIQ
jgi:hypothetical protein